jgi:hypothetical protein
VTCPRTSLGALALGALARDEAAAVSAHAQTCRDCGEELGHLTGLVALLAPVRDRGLVPSAPPADGLARLLDAAATERAAEQSGTAGGPEHDAEDEPGARQVGPARAAGRRRHTWQHRRVLAAAAVVVLAVLGLGLSALRGGPVGWSDPDSLTVHAASGPVEGVARVTRSGSGADVVLSVRGLPAHARCRLLATPRAGAPVVVERWEDYSRTGTMEGTSTLRWADLDRLVLEASDGRELLVVPVRS